MSGKKSKKKDAKDSKDKKDKKAKKDKKVKKGEKAKKHEKPTTKEASATKDSAKKDTATKGSTKDSKKSSTPKSSKETTTTSAAKGSKTSTAPKKSKGSKDKESTTKDSQHKSKNSQGKSPTRKGSSKKTSIQLAQVRELLDDSGSASTEHRILVDRLWPRGVKKERLAHDEWNKQVAPSTDLRKAFHGGDLDFDDFRDHYLRELSDSEAPQQLLDSAARAKAKTIVLIYGAKDAEHNHAQVLADHLRSLSRN